MFSQRVLGLRGLSLLSSVFNLAGAVRNDTVTPQCLRSSCLSLSFHSKVTFPSKPLVDLDTAD